MADNMIASLWGLEGSGKSSMGLTWTKPLLHMDLDLGGFDRAIWRAEKIAKESGKPLRIYRCDTDEDISTIEWEDYDIVTKPYPVPAQIDRLLGVPTVTPGSRAKIRFPRKVVGIKELWQTFVIDYATACQVKAVRTIMPDSATQLWWIAHTGYLQEKQEIQLARGMKEDDDKFREQLTSLEYGEPNSRMQQLIYTARSYGKSLIMTHYPKDIYAEKLDGEKVISYKTGNVEPDGFKHTVKLDDIVFWTYTEIERDKKSPDYGKPIPHARISLKCGLNGLGMTAVGMELPEPSYDSLIMLQNMMLGVDEEDDDL